MDSVFSERESELLILSASWVQRSMPRPRWGSSDDVFGMLATPLLDMGVGGVAFSIDLPSYKSQSADSLCAWVRGKRQSSLHVGHGQHRYEAGIANRVTLLICNGPGVEGSF